MNYREIIGPDELDWKVVPLDWKKIGKDELKLGTPMSRDGVEANDASCYGILMDDVEKNKHEQARVIVSGCVDFAKAEEYSGIKISAEAKKAIGKVWSQGGGGLTELPEGYPYKEGVTIEWDGNTEGREHTAAMGMDFYWVSPEILTDEEIKNGTVISNDGSASEMAEYWDQFVSGGQVTEDATLTTSVAVVRKANAEVAGAVFSTPGVYFMRMELGGNVGFISKFTNGTTQRMAEEFMPLLTSPNGTKYKLTVSDDGTLSAVAVS